MRSCQDISSLLDEIYDAALDASRWPQVLERFAQLFGSSSAHLSTENLDSTQGRLISFGTDPQFARLYADYYFARNVLWHRIVQRSLNGILTNRIMMPVEEFRKSEFYNDFLKPQNGDEILCSVAYQRTNFATNLTLWRPQRLGPWQPKQMKMLAGVSPHLRRALQVNEKIGNLNFSRNLAWKALQRVGYGVMLVDANAEILFANEAAEAQLGDGCDLRVECGLAARRTSDTHKLRRMISAAAQGRTGSSLILTREARPSLLLMIMPMKAETCCLVRDQFGAIVFIKDPERPSSVSLAAFAEYYGLTAAQAGLAVELIKGDGVPAAAYRLGISRHTVRTHLMQIFQKTATKRQAELVRLMLDWAEGTGK